MPATKFPRRLVAAALALSLAAAVGCGVGSQEQEHKMPEALPGALSAVPSTVDGVEKLSSNRLVPVYWLQATDQSVYLYREYAQAEEGGDPVTDAIHYLLNSTPGKDGWFTYLKPTSEIGVSIGADNVITVDLPAKVFSAKLDEGLSERSIQQLVFTATAAAANAGLLGTSEPPRLRLLVDGQSRAEVFDGFPLQDEYVRDASFMAPIWIIDPQNESAQASGKVKLNGRSVPYAGGTFYNLEKSTPSNDWAPVDDYQQVDSELIAEDGSFSVEMSLAPGRYRVTLWGQDDTADTKLGRVTSIFTVN